MQVIDIAIKECLLDIEYHSSSNFSGWLAGVEYTTCFFAGSNDTIQSDDNVPVMLKIWRIRSTPSLLSLLGRIWPGLVALDGVLTMGQIELNWVLILNWIIWYRTIVDPQTVYLWLTELFEIELLWYSIVCKQKIMLIILI